MDELRMESNAHFIAAGYARAGDVVPRAVEVVTDEYAGKALGTIRKNASGRPGPRKRTGDYLRNWGRRKVRTPQGYGVLLFNNSPQGLRLEKGFWYMTDRLGRLFRQPAYPHVAPAARTWAAPYARAVRDRIVFVVRQTTGAR